MPLSTPRFLIRRAGEGKGDVPQGGVRPPSTPHATSTAGMSAASPALASMSPLLLAQPPVQCMPPPDAFPPCPRKTLKSTDILVRKKPKRVWSSRAESGSVFGSDWEKNMGKSRGTAKRRRLTMSSGTKLSWKPTPPPLSLLSSRELEGEEDDDDDHFDRDNSDGWAEGDDGNEGDVSYRIIRRIPRRFGIFCTGKVSMHGPNPSAMRARSIGGRLSV
ncbi:hypothetical protein CC1G_09427 [Coprinopsis cinerea okayama7|uniref:Uncharacterized protein n=1 Tax=Coprinopsis cinerea (strain Okayama-7 / 130 / ATCC MYA-4618 / FGSC 9003) TaxID=240176 RepID=A8NIJ9_COPC7|nr:hypothetical protein CC1G_09427 [Coprinopsis cinerea okayama7\|eukprot:XP_001834013.2 hypothetical protein CC1G_09427 [Coprinopsis cinerea okayama7\